MQTGPSATGIPDALLGTYDALSHRFTVSVPPGSLADEIERVLVELSTPATTTPSHGPQPSHLSRYVVRTVDVDELVLEVDGDRIDAGPTAAHVLAMLLWDVNRQAVAATATDHVVLHAGAVEVDGRVIVLPAPMEAGKTTLVTALVRAGAGYLSDELATIPEPGTHVLPYPKALSLDPGSWDLFPDLAPTAERRAASPHQWLVVPEALRPGATRHDPVPLGRVVLPRHRPGHVTRLTRLDPIGALKVLAECTFSFHEEPARLLPRLARLVETVPVDALTVGDGIDDAVAAVLAPPN